MTQKKLFEILSLLKSVNITYRHWNMVWNIVNTIKTEKVNIVDAKWYDKFKLDHPNYYPLKLDDISTWLTYDNGDCVNIKFENHKGRLYCECIIYDGDSLNGFFRKRQRFYVKMYLPVKFIKKYLHDVIDGKLNKFIENSYYDYLEQQKHDWMVNFKNALLIK